jgi:hypothetical protein
MHTFFPVSGVCLVLSLALPTLVHAQQWGFPEHSRRTVPRSSIAAAPPPQLQSESAGDTMFNPPSMERPTVQVDKNSGRYLQSVGKRVADRPLACPPRKRTSQH